ncbi:MAG TPA: sigma-54 dependent transcriptional regulator [Longimicrobiales bacterium]|nr:sigma-54 dependent transcriptional regulator [Longimicrobiales bacterium]
MPTPAGPDQDLISVDPDQRRSIEILIVDDEHSLRESCASLLTSEGFPVTVCAKGDEAVRLVRRRRFDILLLDLYMSQASGLEIMRAALETNADSLAIVMTGNPSVESSVTALREGAWDYLPKPFSATHFQVLVGRAAHAVVVARESQRRVARPTAKQAADEAGDHAVLMGRSKAFRHIVDVATKVARTDASVFITGESGSGKEVIAQFIHRHSRRSSRELVPVNCAAIPETLLESEMFGHVEGAFTGAVREKQGLLEVANGGTLFLDELTELPLPTQAKLLRVLQDGVVRRVGSTKTDAVVNVRFIAATNRDPIQAIREGALRKDLHYRLRVVPLHIPPLRERPEDIPYLAEQFLDEFWRQHREPDSPAPRFSEPAMRTLVQAHWPGNVRELRNVIEHLVVLVSAGAEISADEIPFIDDQPLDGYGAGPAFSAAVMNMDYHAAREHVLGEFETAYLKHVVQSAGGNISDAARMAGVDRTTLYRLMEKHGTRRDSLIQGETGAGESPGP